MVKAAILQFSQDSQGFYGKDRPDIETLPARTQGCRGKLDCLLSNTSRYSTERRQVPSRVAGFGSKKDEAIDSLFWYCQERLVTDQSHLFRVLLGIAVVVFTALRGEEESLPVSLEVMRQ